jgi:hypothetical protein
MKIRANPSTCPQCGHNQPLIAISEDGTRICGPCVGFTFLSACRQCGTTADPYEHDRCARCVMIERVRDLLTATDGEIPSVLRKLAEIFESIDNPRSAIRWLSRSAGARLLASLAVGETEMTHAALDALPQSKPLQHLRHMLVHAGVLPGRSEYLERISPWLDQLLAGQPADDSNLIRAYAQWDVLRRARQRAGQRPFTHGSGRRARAMIRIALELLIWLREREQPLNELHQGDIEEWLSAHPGRQSYLINGFLKWANRRGLTGKITLTAPPRDDPVSFLDSDDRWRELHRCLTDDGMTLPARVAGALLFLYGLQPSRLVTLRSDDVQQQGNDIYLQIGNGRLPMPPALAALVTELRDHGHIPSAVGRASNERSWLFHGVAPGRPLSVSGLRRHLGNAGIHIRAAHNSALIEFATDLPAPVVADALGIHIETATRWSKYAKRDWADYLAARAEHLPDPGRSRAAMTGRR